MAKGFSQTQLTQIAELMDSMISRRLGQPLIAPQAPVVGANSTAQVPLNLGNDNPAPVVDLVLPLSPIHNIRGERFVELAKLGAGAYSEMSNTIFALIREQILENNGGMDYSLMSKADKSELNKYITKIMSDRVNEIRRKLKAATKAQEGSAPTLQTPQTPVTSAPAPVVEQPRIDFSKLNANLTPTPTPSEDSLNLSNEKDTNPNSIGKVGDREVAKLVEECREGIKQGVNAGVILKQWFQKDNNQKRQKIAYKIVEAAAAQLNIRLTPRKQEA